LETLRTVLPEVETHFLRKLDEEPGRRLMTDYRDKRDLYRAIEPNALGLMK
jgi:hypothetical protein